LLARNQVYFNTSPSPSSTAASTYASLCVRGEYLLTSNGELCPSSQPTIQTSAECQAAASLLGLTFVTSWNGPGDHPGCLLARNQVYFNTSPSPSSTATSTYASICVRDDCICGLAKRQTRIVGGVETEVNEYPWQVLLYSNRGPDNSGNCVTGRFICGGEVIGDLWVLTAAHCLSCDVTPSGLQVFLGEHNRFETSEANTIQVSVAEIIHHELYSSTTSDYDIALLKLTEKIDFISQSHIRPICLPGYGSNNDYNDYIATVTGWGATSEGGFLSNVLREVDVTVTTNQECNTAYSSVLPITDRMICAAEASGEGGKDSCGGDSGGPLVTKEAGSSGQVPGQNYELIGVVSFGVGCARPNFPGVYVRVTTQLQWIREKTLGSWKTCPRN